VYRIEIYDRSGVPLTDLHDVSGLRYAFDRTAVFELPIRSAKAVREHLEHNNIVVIYHTLLEPWVGFLAEPDWGAAEGHITFTAESYKLKLAQRTTGIVTMTDKLPGEIFAALINQANGREHTGIHVGSMYMGQKHITLEMRREFVYDKVQELCEKAELEWYLDFVSPTVHVANLVEKYGRDLTASIVVQGGFDTDGEVEFRHEVAEMANYVYGVGKLREGYEVPEGEDEYSHRPVVERSDTNSIDRYGLIEGVVELDAEDPSTLAAQTETELEKHAWPVIVSNPIINNRSGLWGQFKERDIITLHLPEVGYGGVVVPARVTGREVDPERELMTLACEIVQGRRAETLDLFRYMHYPQPVYSFGPFPKDSTS
jgi:hypothetical protein